MYKLIIKQLQLLLVLTQIWSIPSKILKNLNKTNKQTKKKKNRAEVHAELKIHVELKIWSTLNKILWRRQRHPTPVLLPGKSHGQRSLVGCGPWGS